MTNFRHFAVRKCNSCNCFCIMGGPIFTQKNIGMYCASILSLFAISLFFLLPASDGLNQR